METTKKYHLIFSDGGTYVSRYGTVEDADNVKSFETHDEVLEFLSIDGDKTFNELGEITDKTDEEIAADTIVTLTARNVAIKKELQGDISDALLKCFADGLDFTETYPELSAQRTVLLTEYNENESSIK